MPFREDLKPERLLALEEEVLATWRAEKTFEASLARRAGAPPWIFYEGPPTANGRPGVHHVLARAVKDLACRLKTMQGFLVDRRAGWDTHGLPVEIEAERRLHIEGKRQIEAFGIAKFNEECRASVFRYLEDWNALTRRMGYWVDLDHPYITCERDYVETLWWILATLFERGLLTRGHKVLPYCPRCSTPLSSHEVGLGFRDVQDPSVTVRFRLVDDDASLLVWTTTPWTLPANLAVAVHPHLDYVKVEIDDGPRAGERLWLAEPRLSILKEGHHVLESVEGSALAGRRYRRLFDWYPVDDRPPAFTVLAADFVSTDEGTGCVHIAPAYGQEDYDLGRAVGLPVLHPVDEAGRFRPGSPVEGRFVKDADKEILGILKERGALYDRATIEHAYPHCWRCGTPLLYYARESWYLETTRFKDAMLRNNASVAWYPESVGTGRFGQWLEGNVDWAISRDRYWGTPLPVWLCDRAGCDAVEAIASYDDLERRSGKRIDDPHRPWVDEHVWSCPKGCGGTMRRTPEVADAWFDSGAMPFAQWHYPFENRERVEAEHPADFISEAVDQTRGWFYTLLAVSTMLTGKPAYRACASLGHILDAQGKKMSKSRGNVVDPFEMIDRYGADVVRWHLLVRPLGPPLRYDEKDLVEIRNRFFGTLLNVYAFFATYANVDGYDGSEPEVPLVERPAFDRWLVSRLHGLFAGVAADLESWDTAHAGQRIADFVVEDLSNWYVRRNRRRFFRAERTRDKQSAYQTLHAALLSVAELAAPFIPFVTDALYRSLADGLEGAEPSVHLARWPTADAAVADERLETGMAALRRIVSLGHAARDEAGIRVRQPLARLEVFGVDGAARAFVVENAEIALDELNVKEMEILERPAAGVRLCAALDKREAARRLGALTPVVSAALEALDTDGVVKLLRASATEVETPRGRVALERADVRVVVEAGEGHQGAFAGGLLVTLDTRVTPDLEREGLAREVCRQLQRLRKDQGLRVEDRVRARWHADGPAAEAIQSFSAWIAGEVLAVDFRRVDDASGLEPLRVPGGHDVRAAVERA